MVVKSVKVVYCDQCGTDGPTKSYTVRFPEGFRRTFDLCAVCSDPLDKLSGMVEPGEQGPKRHQQKVLSDAELASMVSKAERKPKSATKKAAKKAAPPSRRKRA